MFFYSSSSKFRFPLEISKLSTSMNWLSQAAIWAEEKWGYVRQHCGIETSVEKRREIINGMKDNFYIVTYAGQPVGMFALVDYPSMNATIHAKELMYFYIDKSFRSM